MERYKQVCKQINEQINPSQDFIDDLKLNLNNRVAQEKMKRKTHLCKVAMIFFTITLISSGAFAMDIGNWLSQIFSNTDESMQIAVENGYVQNVEMDYIENQGIGIKVNSLVIDDNKINIVFDVKGEIDGELVIKDLLLTTGGEEYPNHNLKILSSSYNRTFKSIDKKSHIMIIKMSNVEQNLQCSDNLNIIVDGLYIMSKNKETIEIDEKWYVEVLLDEDNFHNNVTSNFTYAIEKNNYLEDYKINVTNTGTNIQLNFKNNFNRYNLINKDNIYAETEDGKKYLCKDWSRITDNRIKMNIPITVYDNIEKFYIILNLENEKIILNVIKNS